MDVANDDKQQIAKYSYSYDKIIDSNFLYFLFFVFLRLLFSFFTFLFFKIKTQNTKQQHNTKKNNKQG